MAPADDRSPTGTGHSIQNRSACASRPRDALEGSALSRLRRTPTFPGDPIGRPLGRPPAGSTPSRAEPAAGAARSRSRHPEPIPSRAVPAPRATLSGGRAAPALRFGSRLAPPRSASGSALRLPPRDRSPLITRRSRTGRGSDRRNISLESR